VGAAAPWWFFAVEGLWGGEPTRALFLFGQGGQVRGSFFGFPTQAAGRLFGGFGHGDPAYLAVSVDYLARAGWAGT
jgi:hypothetical protein